MQGFDPVERASSTRAHTLWVVALIVLCGISLWLRVSHISASLPYPYHVDESAVIGPARSMLVSGDLHPGAFNYPSFPKYLAAAGMAVGFVRAAPDQGLIDVRNIGGVTYPYYDSPGAVEGAKQLFALLSVVALAVTGLVAWLITARSAAVFIGPLFLAGSDLFFSHSWLYVNVDIVATCFALLTVASCLQATARPSLVRMAVLPGCWAGLAAASKYTLGVVLLPVLIGIWLYQRDGRRLVPTLIAMTASGVTFLAVVPYSVLDLPGFLNGLASERWHYASGHIGADGPAGMAQLGFYADHFLVEFGVVGAVLAVLGVFGALARDWRRTILLASFPVTLIALLAAQRVHFPRNVLPIHPLYAVLVGYGVILFHGWVCRFIEQRAWSRRRRSLASAALLAALLIAALPTERLLGQWRVTPDSRNLARAWLAENVPAGWTVVVPTELAVDTRGLEEQGFNLREAPMASIQQQQDVLSSMRGQTVAFLPVWGADPRFGSPAGPAEMNDASSRMTVLQEFGQGPVLLNYPPPTAWGNPRFRVVTTGEGPLTGEQPVKSALDSLK